MSAVVAMGAGAGSAVVSGAAAVVRGVVGGAGTAGVDRATAGGVGVGPGSLGVREPGVGLGDVVVRVRDGAGVRL